MSQRRAVVDPDANETRAVHALVDLAGARVLEIGAGDGRMTWRFAEAASEVVALDPLRDDIERAIADTPAQLRSRVRFTAADATTYRYPRARFDVAVLSYSLCCLPPESVVHVLRQVHRTLRPGGMLLDVHPVPRPSTIEVRNRGATTFVGTPDDRVGEGKIRAARTSLNRVLRDGLFEVHGRRWFDFEVHHPSIDAWLRRREERGSTSVISDELLDGARRAMGQSPNAVLIASCRTRATALTRK